MNKRKMLEDLHQISSELANKDRQILDLREALAARDKQFDEMAADFQKYVALCDATPADCKRGTWCKACEFVKEIELRYSWGVPLTIYFCGKGDSCPNFVQKEG